MSQRNPFRAANLSPGRLPYHFPLGHDAGQLIQRFCENNFLGQIVGPHGSGKSTLLVHLAKELEKGGQAVECDVELIWLEPTSTEQGQAAKQRLYEITKSDMPMDFPPGSIHKVIALDGLETLTWLERRRFLRAARRSKWGVLATAHRDLGLPPLWETQVTPESARQVVDALVELDAKEKGADPPPPVPDELIHELVDRHDGDLRETLFSLYDWYQEQ